MTRLEKINASLVDDNFLNKAPAEVVAKFKKEKEYLESKVSHDKIIILNASDTYFDRYRFVADRKDLEVHIKPIREGLSEMRVFYKY